MPAAARAPAVRTVVDIGGQDSKGIRIENGKVVDFVMNDKKRNTKVASGVFHADSRHFGPGSSAKSRADVAGLKSLRGVLRLVWQFNDSRIIQRLTIYRHSPRIDTPP